MDLLVHGESGWKLLEAKSGQTVAPTFFKHLKTLAVLPWSALAELDW